VSNDEKNLGKLIKEQRTMSGRTLQQLSSASGISTSHLGRIERGERFPSARVLRKLAKSFGFDEAQLFTLAGYLSPQSPVTGSETPTGRLDPYVANVLSQQPVEAQRFVISILTILMNIARGIACNIEIAEYIHRNYPGIDEDTLIKIKDILEHPRG